MATDFEFPDGTVRISTDDYGSGAGCDAWEDAGNDDVRTMVTSLVTSARVFATVEEARAFCSNPKDAEDYPFDAAVNLSF